LTQSQFLDRVTRGKMTNWEEEAGHPALCTLAESIEVVFSPTDYTFTARAASSAIVWQSRKEN